MTWKQTKDMGSPVRNDVFNDASVGPSFVDELHPELKDLVEVKKLAAQIEAIGHDESSRNRAMFFQIRRNLNNVKTIDYWLKQNRFSVSA